MKRKLFSSQRSKDDVELAGEFGTYNIQRTSDTDHAFPAIAQGLPRGLYQKNSKNNKKQVQ